MYGLTPAIDALGRIRNVRRTLYSEPERQRPVWRPVAGAPTRIVNSGQLQVLELELDGVLHQGPVVVHQTHGRAERNRPVAAKVERRLHMARRAVLPLITLRLILVPPGVLQFDPLMDRIRPSVIVGRVARVGAD